MIPILRCRDVRGQLRALEEMETPIPAPNSSGRPPDCYLTRLPPSAKGQQDLLTLGPYSRWLIALSLLLPSNGNGALQGDLRSHPVDCVFAVRGPRNKRMMAAHRYNHLVPQENPLDDVLELILTKLNDLFGPIRGKITRAEFLTVWVPISP